MSDTDAATARALSKRVGVLGGGQLGRMMALAAHRLGVRVTVLDPGGDNSPAGQVCDAIQGAARSRCNRRLAFSSTSFTGRRISKMKNYIPWPLPRLCRQV